MMLIATLLFTLTAQTTWADNVDLSTVTEDKVLQNGDVVTGILDTDNYLVKISIADGATVTLNGVTINGVYDNKSPLKYKWAGITCEGDATIILADGSQNAIKGFHSYCPGIYVPQNKTLTIRGGTAGTGKLTASSNGDGAAIGGGHYEDKDCGHISITGGIITAIGGDAGGAGIGCGRAENYVGSCGNISITGGTVTATGGNGAAGIGGSNSNDGRCTCGDITIEGGIIKATGGSGAAGIGGGNKEYNMSSSISSCGNILITDGVTSITARAGSGAPYSIGDGKGEFQCNSVTVKGVTGNVDGPKYQDPLVDTYTVVFDKNGGSGSMDDQTITTDVPTQLDANTFTREGYFFVCWNTAADGTGTSYADQASVTNLAATDQSMTLYAQWFNNNLSTLTVDYTVPDGTVLTGTLSRDVKVSIASGATVTLNGVTIGSEYGNNNTPWAGITCEGNATIVLADGTTNTVTGLHANYPAIFVPQNSTLTIQGGTAGTGSLTARCTNGGYAAAIGGGNEIRCGNIIIDGGTITANGYHRSAAIGAGLNSQCGDITITTGVKSVTASVQSYSAPYIIGAGYGSHSSVGTVTIGGVMTGGITSSHTITSITYDPTVNISTTVSYNANGGSGTTMPNQGLLFGFPIALNANTYTAPAGYSDFIGWATTPDGDKVYDDEQIVSDLTGTNGAATLYAKWKKLMTNTDITATVPNQTLEGPNSPFDIIYYKFNYVNSSYSVSSVQDFITGMGVVVMDGSTPLSLGTDYQFGSVTYTNGAPITTSAIDDECKVEIVGIGNYAGSRWETFQVIAPDANGTWGDNNLAWSFDGDSKTLTITGTGEMKAAASFTDYPWYGSANYIETVTIGDGVTSIAAYAFGSNGTVTPYSNLTSVSLPSTLEAIGDNAFAYSGLTSINIPVSVTNIDYAAFNQCTSLASITLNGGVTIGDAAFPTNTNVTVTIANSLTLHNGTEEISGDITDMNKLNGKTLRVAIPYIKNGTTEYCTNYTVLNNTMTTIPAGWYVVKNDVTFSGNLSTNANGEVHIILCDGATLTANNIEPQTNNDDLCIYGQSQGTGTANISGNIMGNYSVSIYGGTINVTGYIMCPQGSIGIYGGTVTAGSFITYETGAQIRLGGATVKAGNYDADNGVTILPGITYYDGEGHGYNAGDLSADEIAAIAGKTLTPAIPYIAANGNTAYCTNYTVLNNTMTTIAAGWYVVKNDVEFNGNLSTNASGEVHIILCDGATLTASRIFFDNSNDLYIYGQSQGTGTANISGNIWASNSIEIYGGIINATGDITSPTGSVSIYGGNVTAAKISGKYNLTFTGGTITAGSLTADEECITLGGATVKANSYSAQNGVIITNGITYYDGEGHDYNAGPVDPSAIAGKTLTPSNTFSVTANEDPAHAGEYWSTFYHPVAGYTVPSGTTAYIGTLNGSTVTLTEITDGIIPANTAVVLKATSGNFDLTRTATASTFDVTTNELKGGATVAAGKVPYTLAAKSGTVGFYKFTGAALNPNKAHLEIATTLAPAYFGFDENTTAISEHESHKSYELSGEWYSLDGRKLQGMPTQKGLYIVNGKKIVIK
jgi:hypothetical protein